MSAECMNNVGVGAQRLWHSSTKGTNAKTPLKNLTPNTWNVNTYLKKTGTWLWRSNLEVRHSSTLKHAWKSRYMFQKPTFLTNMCCFWVLLGSPIIKTCQWRFYPATNFWNNSSELRSGTRLTNLVDHRPPMLEKTGIPVFSLRTWSKQWLSFVNWWHRSANWWHDWLKYVIAFSAKYLHWLIDSRCW